MRKDDLIIISVDDHIIEPANMFERHASAAFKDRMPYVTKKNGFEAWVFEDRVIPNLALNAVAGKRPEEYGFEPTSYDHIRRGTYDPKARVDDMSADGILASVNFPSWPGVAGQTLLAAKDKALAAEVVRAHNDWNIDEWCGAAKERFIPCCLIPFWDPDAAAKEIKRIKAKGANSVTMLPNPIPDGLPSWHQPYWDPILAACEDNEVVINLHISDATKAVPSPDSAVDAFIAMMGVSLFSTAVDLVFSPVFKKHPKLKMALSEGGAGWVPNCMERMDFIYKRHHSWTKQDFGGRLPSEVFREHFYVCVVEDPVGVKLRDQIGIDIMMWEGDYPHAEATWPHSPENIMETFDPDISDEDMNKITHLNAMRAYQFDPFRIRPREKCTVGALRAEAKHVSLDYLPRGGIAPSRGEGVVSLRDVMGQVGEAYTLHIGEPEAAQA
ncbi:MAG: amidohydrolase family protein [Hyphomonadaceae bacterium]